MKRMLFFLIALGAGSLLFFSTGCNRESSNTVDQDRIFTTYELFYNANEDKTYARATFQFSSATGTRLELASPSEIIFEGEPLTWKPVLAFYEKEYAGWVDEGTFEWTDADGNTFTNSISIDSIGFPVSGIDSIPRDAAYELFWEGEPLSEFQVVSLTANGENEGDAQAFSTDDLGAESIILAKDKLENIGSGPGSLVLDRSYSPPIQDPTGAGGLTIGRYRAENEAVYFQ